MPDLYKLEPAPLRPDNGLRARRLQPWPELNAPFEGSWCVVEPGATSGAHAHHEYEIWIAMSGTARVRTAAGDVDFTAGDILHFTPGLRHQVVNEGAEQFRMYSIWWDTAMAEDFGSRHARGRTAVEAR